MFSTEAFLSLKTALLSFKRGLAYASCVDG
jgi:hypothetical protein